MDILQNFESDMRERVLDLGLVQNAIRQGHGASRCRAPLERSVYAEDRPVAGRKREDSISVANAKAGVASSRGNSQLTWCIGCYTVSDHGPACVALAFFSKEGRD